MRIGKAFNVKITEVRVTYFVGIAVPSSSVILHSFRSLHFPFFAFYPTLQNVL